MIITDRPDLLRKSLELHEGRKLNLYLDSTGHYSIGVGHNLSIPQSPRVIDFLYQEDVSNAIQFLDTHLSWVETLDDVRKRAFIELAFNLGGALLTFHKALGAAQMKNWPLCAREFQSSVWARQVGPRAPVLCGMLLTGKDPYP